MMKAFYSICFILHETNFSIMKRSRLEPGDQTVMNLLPLVQHHTQSVHCVLFYLITNIARPLHMSDYSSWIQHQISDADYCSPEHHSLHSNFFPHSAVLIIKLLTTIQMIHH